MAFKIKFPIRTKLMLLISGSVLIATVAYLLLAIQLFKDDKVQLVYQLNANIVKTLAAETQAQLMKISDKVKLLTQGHRDANWVHAVFDSESDLIAYTLYRLDSNATSEFWSPVSMVRNVNYLKLYGLDEKEIDRIREKQSIPFDKVLAKGSWASNSTLADGAPILTYSVSIDVVTGSGTVGKYVAVADLKMDRILKRVGDPSIATVYIVNSDGNVIAHPDPKMMTSGSSLGSVPIVQDAVSSPVSMQLKKFDWNGTSWIGAFSSVGTGGLFVVSQVPEAEAFMALRELLKKSVIFAALIITLSLLISGWMASTFTEPLRRLLLGTEKIAQADFGYSIHVRSHDEIGLLALAFNTMSGHLQHQRAQIEGNQQELNRKVIERTEALEQEKKKVFEAQDTLLRTTRLASLGELAGAAAHEVLNPINNMGIRIERITKQGALADKNDTELLQEILTSWHKAFTEEGWGGLEKELKKPAANAGKSLGEEDFENLISISKDLIARATERNADMAFLAHEMVRITRIVNSMRALSRVGGERRPLDVHVPIEETTLALGDLFKKRKVELIKDFSSEPRDLFFVIGDKDELVQVFSNILRNALQAVVSAKRRAGAIRITTQRTSERVEVRIIDNGTGITPENIPKLFEPNFTTKSLEEGTGLGLSISRRLVRAFGGDLELEKSVDGEGTTFLIWIPLAS